MILSAVFACSFVACTGNTESSTSESKKDPAKDFVNYVDPETATYKFDFEETVTPYYLGNVIYNETVLLEDNGQTISGKLQYDAVKILSVRDYTFKTEYASENYSVEGNVITAKKDGELPYLTSENLMGKNIPAPYREVNSITNVSTDYMMMGGTIYTESPLLYSNQIQVSYVFDPYSLKLDEFASYATSGLPKTKAKLSAGEDVKIVVTGDSVAEGCSSSGHFNHEPFMPCWADLMTRGLDEAYEGKVTLSNQAVGGKTSEWGCAAAQTSKIKAANPDVVFIHFGINDLGGGASANGFQDNISALILDVQTALPDCEFVIIKAFAPCEKAYDYEAMKKYWRKMDDLTASIDNVYTLDMFTQSLTLFGEKKYFDVSANGINHLNDYSSRLYAMNILGSLIDYKK